MQKYKSNITTTTGAAIRNVPVSVLKEDGSLASIFLDRAGTVQAPNPMATDSQGAFYFYAVNGRYSLRTTVEGITITDDDVVLMNDPEEIATAGPIAEAVAAAEAAAKRAEDAVQDSGIPELVAAAQNAVVDANNAVTQAQSAAALAGSAKNDAAAANDAAQAALSSAQSAAAQANSAGQDAQAAAAAAAQSAASIDTAFLRNRANHTGTQQISTISGLQTALDSKVQTEAGKSLMSDAEHTKLANLAVGVTFSAVPVDFSGASIIVTQPHLRFMVWDGSKYIRAPWHMPGVLFYSTAPAASIAHGIQVRSDVTYNTADHPDLAEILGIGAATFVLPDGRARVLRSTDLGRGIDSSLVNGYLQEDAIRNITGNFAGNLRGSWPTSGAFASDPSSPTVAEFGTGTGWSMSFLNFNASRQVPTANENRVKSLSATLYVTR